MTDQIQSSEPSQGPLSTESIMNSEREHNGLKDKSMVCGTTNGNIKLLGTSTNQMNTTDDQMNLTRKKVVKVVRRVVRKVLPTEEDEITGQTKPSDKASEAAKPAAEPVNAVPVPTSVSKPPMMSGFSFKHDIIKTEDKDDISRELTSLMVRGRTREPQTQKCKDVQPEKIKLDKRSEIQVENVESDETREEQKKDKISLKPQEVVHKPTGSGRIIQGLKSPEVAVNTTSIASLGLVSSKLTHCRSSLFQPDVSFILAPLSQPPEFIPESKPATNPTPRSTPITPVAKIFSSFSLPSHFTQAAKPAPFETPMSSEPPCPNPHPLSPPAGFIYSQHKVQYNVHTLHVWSPFGTLMWKVHGHLKCMFEKSTVEMFVRVRVDPHTLCV